MRFTDYKIIPITNLSGRGIQKDKYWDELPRRMLRSPLNPSTFTKQNYFKDQVQGFRSEKGDMTLLAYPTVVSGNTTSVSIPHEEKYVYIGDPCYTMSPRHYYFYLEVMCNHLDVRGLFDFDLIDQRMPNRTHRFTIHNCLDDGRYKSVGKGGSQFLVDSGQIGVMSGYYVDQFGRQDMGIFSSYKTQDGRYYPVQYNIWGEGNGGGKLDTKEINSFGFYGRQGRSRMGFNVYSNDTHLVFGSHRIRHYMC